MQKERSTLAQASTDRKQLISPSFRLHFGSFFSNNTKKKGNLNKHHKTGKEK